MERLTIKSWRNLDPWETCGQDNYCKRGCHEQGGCAKGCIVPRIYARLAAYEDTGLEPEEIKELRELCTDEVAELARTLHKAIESGEVDHLRDLLKAEKEGRMVLLPCKVGDTVWVIWGKDVIYYIVDRIHILANNQVQIRAKHHVIDNVYLYPDMFGKTVFLTREEALLEQKGGDG